MNILFVEIHNNNPFDIKWGSIQRSNLLIQACAQCGHVDVILFNNDEKLVSNIKNCDIIQCNTINKTKQHKLIKIWRKIYCLFGNGPLFFESKNKDIEYTLDNIIKKNNYDKIVIRYVPDAVLCGLIKYTNRLILDVDDSPVSISRNRINRSKTIIHKWYNTIIHKRTKRNLSLLLNKVGHSFFSNPDEIIGNKSSYLPNVPFYQIKTTPCNFQTTGNDILFVGFISFGANLKGLNRFFNNIYPLIIEKIPDVKIKVVGKCNFKNLPNWKLYPNVQVKGFVENLAQEYENSRVVIAPIYEGAGTNIKVLEAMQMSRPCVTTPEGIRGFKDIFTPNKDYLVSTSDQEFADNIIDMLTKEKYNHFITQNAHQKLINNYSKQTFFKKFKVCL
jgi:glycosyltransferase involved in cell wall biosynthesis